MVTSAYSERCVRREIAKLRGGFSARPSGASRLAASLAHEGALVHDLAIDPYGAVGCLATPHAHEVTRPSPWIFFWDADNGTLAAEPALHSLVQLLPSGDVSRPSGDVSRLAIPLSNGNQLDLPPCKVTRPSPWIFFLGYG
jgi:hypothetical protein